MRLLFIVLLFTFTFSLSAQSTKEELRGEMINEPAPDFTLRNLNGDKVTLSDLKGKTVILDFWATWCGPCLASFPGIQKVVNDLENDETVEFLFIDTWESGSDNAKISKVKKFMDKKGYTFNVVFDLDDKVVKDYGLQGIPTKIILGPDGNIKFRKLGGGPSDVLVDELYSMIDLTKGS